MDTSFKENIECMAREIRTQARKIKVDTFLSYLYTSDIINKYLDMLLPDKKISRAGFNILHNLILNDGNMIPTDISIKTVRSKFSVTRVIDTLEKQGLVERLPVDKDRRTRRICITREGLRVVEKATIDSRERLSHEIFHMLDEKCLVEFNNVLKDIRRHVLTQISEINNRKKTALIKS